MPVIRCSSPGDRRSSWLYLAASWEQDELQMPPKENDRLTGEQLEALGRWIDLGAPWPDAQRVERIRQRLASGVIVPTSGGLSPQWDQRRYEPGSLWAYRPLDLDVKVPATPHSSGNPIDAFIEARLKKLGIPAAPRADRRTLIRRLSFDTTGLPPTPEQVTAFVNDPCADEEAWERLVDRFLASPHFGEQWARHWLDVVRYADSAGLANDYERPNAWRYRDYVVRQLNADRPLDEFIRQQIAGDEMAPHDPESWIAVGMLRMGPWEQTAMSVDRITRQQFLDDVTDMIGQAFLAHPLQCARCHDHKFDPVPTRDYYRMQAVFATTQFAEPDAAWVEGENRQGFDKQRAYLQQRIQFFESVLERLREKEERMARQWYAQRGLAYAPRNEKLQQGVPESEVVPRHYGLTAADLGAERIARKYLERHRWELDRFRPIALSVYSGPTPSRKSVRSRLKIPADIARSGKVEQTAILAGGDPFSATQPVTPGILSAVAGMVAPEHLDETAAVTTEVAGRRTEFAQWLTDPHRNPLTPRVLVNRIWLHYFGQGIVATPNNFGTAGAKPTHPELLEFLAVELIRGGWSSKRIHRLILTSDAYCRDIRYREDSARQEAILAQRDPEGNSYARRRIRRLAAEELRDAVLATSGLLNRQVGGIPCRPDLNHEVAVQPRQIMGTYAPVYQPSPDPADRHRRSLYALRLRGLPDPMLEVFNQPSSDRPCELRESSTVAPQSLTLMNSPFSYNRAAALALRVAAETNCLAAASPEASTADTESEQRQFTWRLATQDRQVCERMVDRLFSLVYGRHPDRQQRQWIIEHWQRATEFHQATRMQDVLPPSEVTRTFVDENTGEPFSFTEPLEQNRDYQPDVHLSQLAPEIRGLADICLVLLSSNEFLYVP
ncbi:MAG: hypothetical protein KatS3mg111_1626 [Pirellulaceae bacterium]|nr:MAG: hypothetical protein KatS3mg111_1626 [Pirellulaceae bacterium]